MYRLDRVIDIKNGLSTHTCSNIIHMGRTLTVHALEMELGEEAVFLCGSRRFGYHIPDSDMDIAIYYKTISGEKLSTEHLIYLDMFEFIRGLHPKGIEKDKLIREDTSIEHKRDNENTGAVVFYIPAFDIHLRVHTDMTTFQKEKKIHELMEKRVPVRIIDKIKYYRSNDPSNYPIKGVNIYKSLKEQYVDNDPSLFKRLYWYITSYLHHPKEFM